MFGTTIILAFREIRRHVLRSFLTTLGIIIGVAAVITTIAIGNGAQQSVAEQIKGLGTNLLLVMPGAVNASGLRLGAGTGQRLTEGDAIAIGAEVPEVLVSAPSVTGTFQAVSGNANWSTRGVGTTAEYLEAREWPVVSGRVFDTSELAGSAKVVLLGQTVARELFGEDDPIDRVIRVKGIPLTVIGGFLGAGYRVIQRVAGREAPRQIRHDDTVCRCGGARFDGDGITHGDFLKAGLLADRGD